jgi:hypothetical protein
MSALQFSGLIALLRVSMITISGCALAAAESAAPQTAVTQAASRSAAFWRASAIDDVEAAYRMLREDHPGAAPEVGDGQFQKTLEEAHTLAASAEPCKWTPSQGMRRRSPASRMRSATSMSDHARCSRPQNRTGPGSS